MLGKLCRKLVQNSLCNKLFNVQNILFPECAWRYVEYRDFCIGGVVAGTDLT